ncbi:hypothetical protein HPP92_021187 [Vanilla planifolia]|uniref:Probable purine permease n=1 Tax=Vanilla planifolia TaxID=51239 RepID=A0A835PYD1_VANPL|nr:hypothetical protein HPP92_021187 [Vanilla planifolia]
MGQTRRLMLLLLSVLLVIIGCAGGPLLLRLYFLHGGNRKWFVNFLQTAGFPFLFLPLLYSFFSRRCENPQKRHKLFQLTPPLLVYSTFLGLITGIGNLLGSYGISYLPVSTASLLGSTQLGFTAVFAFFIVRQKFTAPSINAVVLLSFGAVVLGVDADSDQPEGESKGKYYVGFAVMLAAAVLYALSLPLLELMFMKTKQDVTYVLLLEIQFIIGLSATVFCAVGMAVNKDFQAISREGELYGLGETKYYAMVVFIAIIAQIFSVGLVATINYSSALLGGIVIAACIPLAEVLAVFLLHEKFDGEKGVALALSLWGTASYFLWAVQGLPAWQNHSR